MIATCWRADNVASTSSGLAVTNAMNIHLLKCMLMCYEASHIPERTHITKMQHSAYNAFVATANILQLLQIASKTRAVNFMATYDASFICPGPLTLSMPTCVAAVCAMLRVATSERPETAFNALLHTSFDKEMQTSTPAIPRLPPPDVGATCVGRVMCSPISLHAHGHGRKSLHTEQNSACIHAMCGLAVISGGLGGLGRLSASWMLHCGLSTDIVLLGRSGRSTANASPLPVVSALPAETYVPVTSVHVLSTDLAATDATETLFSITTSIGLPPPMMVVHAAGVLDDAMLPRQNLQSLRNVWAPKAAAAMKLATALHSSPITNGFISFSSIASLLGSAGQGNYAASNAVLDACAEFQSSQV